MSVERAVELLEALRTDLTLLTRFERVRSRDELLDVMRATGYGDVSGEDLKTALHAADELEEAELEAVAAGGAPSSGLSALSPTLQQAFSQFL